MCASIHAPRGAGEAGRSGLRPHLCTRKPASAAIASPCPRNGERDEPADMSEPALAQSNSGTTRALPPLGEPGGCGDGQAAARGGFASAAVRLARLPPSAPLERSNAWASPATPRRAALTRLATRRGEERPPRPRSAGVAESGRVGGLKAGKGGAARSRERKRAARLCFRSEAPEKTTTSGSAS